MASLEVGFSHDIFVEWATESKNLVLFTERGQVYLLKLMSHPFVCRFCCFLLMFIGLPPEIWSIFLFPFQFVLLLPLYFMCALRSLLGRLSVLRGTYKLSYMLTQLYRH